MHQIGSHLRHAGNMCWPDCKSDTVYSYHLDAHITSNFWTLLIVEGLEVMTSRTATLSCVYTGTDLWAG